MELFIFGIYQLVKESKFLLRKLPLMISHIFPIVMFFMLLLKINKVFLRLLELKEDSNMIIF